jgi:hypothetical protein
MSEGGDEQAKINTTKNKKRIRLVRIPKMPQIVPNPF